MALALTLLGCQKTTQVKYDLTYGQTSPTGGIEHLTQTKVTVVKDTDLPYDTATWFEFISALEHFHDLEDGIQDGLYWGHVYWVDNFYFL